MESSVNSNAPRPLSRMAMGVILVLGMGLLDLHKPIHAGGINPAKAGSVHLNSLQLNGFTLNGARMKGLTLNGMTVYTRTVSGYTPITAKPTGSDPSDISLLSKQAIVK